MNLYFIKKYNPAHYDIGGIFQKEVAARRLIYYKCIYNPDGKSIIFQRFR